MKKSSLSVFVWIKRGTASVLKQHKLRIDPCGVQPSAFTSQNQNLDLFIVFIQNIFKAVLNPKPNIHTL